jgi:uncharacterized Ntn-hydrolase superfamily protein
MLRPYTVGIGLVVAGMLLASAEVAAATYSIVACDAKTRSCGVAVQTNNLAVGASVPYAQAGVGALVSQYETNPHYGPRGLALLATGTSPSETLKRLLAEDGNFDGQGPEARQVGIVGMDGRTAVYTGEEAQQAEWAGSRAGPGYSVQGNGLAGPQVVEAMERTYLNTRGTLAERLIAALSAGELAGGQTTGRESAALLVRTEHGWPLDTDLRVDHSDDPVGDLRKLFDLQSSRQEVIDANVMAHKGQIEEARSLLMEAVARASAWPRVWIRAARVAESIEEPTLALQYITVAFTQNPAWAQAEIGQGHYAELGANAEFHRWVTADQEHRAIAAYEQVQKEREIQQKRRVQCSRILLEAGYAKEARALLDAVQPGTQESIDLRLLRATTYAATGDLAGAMAQCEAALSKVPNEPRVKLRMAELQWLVSRSDSSAKSN